MDWHEDQWQSEEASVAPADETEEVVLSGPEAEFLEVPPNFKLSRTMHWDAGCTWHLDPRGDGWPVCKSLRDQLPAGMLFEADYTGAIGRIQAGALDRDAADRRVRGGLLFVVVPYSETGRRWQLQPATIEDWEAAARRDQEEGNKRESQAAAILTGAIAGVSVLLEKERRAALFAGSGDPAPLMALYRLLLDKGEDDDGGDDLMATSPLDPLCTRVQRDMENILRDWEELNKA